MKNCVCFIHSMLYIMHVYCSTAMQSPCDNKIELGNGVNTLFGNGFESDQHIFVYGWGKLQSMKSFLKPIGHARSIVMSSFTGVATCRPCRPGPTSFFLQK